MTAVVGIAGRDGSAEQGWPAALGRGVEAAGTVGAVPALRVVTPRIGPLPGADETFVQRLVEDLGGTDPLLVDLARELYAYLTGDSSAVIDQVTSALAPDTAVLVGHGFGAVVAFDLLRREARSGIRGLVTLGAPLGLAPVRRALNVPEPLAAPDGVRWVNVLDPEDVRTGGVGLADLGPGIADQYVDNGERPDSAEAYLAQGQTGLAILTSLTG
jgi:pimeloyl-ACP methyl ester carboxylesterase